MEKLNTDLQRAAETVDLIATNPDPGEALALVGVLRANADWIELSLVSKARADGHTWQEIATRLGVTRQSAHERFARWL